MKFKIIHLLKTPSSYICTCIKIDNKSYTTWIFDVILTITSFYILIHDSYDNSLLRIVVERIPLVNKQFKNTRKNDFKNPSFFENYKPLDCIKR